MRQYQDLMDGGDDNEERLGGLLEEIERQRQQLLGRREALNKTKESMKRNDAKQTEERAEMAAQRMVLQQDHELRQAIQEEERAKILSNMDEELEKAKASYLESALDEERRRLQQEASDQLAQQPVDSNSQKTKTKRWIKIEKKYALAFSYFGGFSFSYR